MTTKPAFPPIFKVLIPVALILAAVVITLSVIRDQVGSRPNTGATTKQLAVGSTVPDFGIKRLSDGKTVKLSELFTGKTKVVMVNFWATWCEACIVEMPSIVRLHKAYADRGFEVAAVNLDENPETAVPPVARKLGMNFPIFVDDEDQQAASVFDVRAIPLTVVVNRDLKVLVLEPGEREWDSAEVKAQMEEWLSK